MAGPISTDDFYNKSYTKEQAFEAIEMVRKHVVGIQFHWREINTGKRIILGVNPAYKAKFPNSKK